MNTYKPHKDIEELFNTLKKDFNIYAYKDNFTDFTAEQEGIGIAYISKRKYRNYTLSTCHKPCIEAGTGYNIFDDSPTITKADVLLAIATTAPVWDRKHLGKIEKYKSFKDYLKIPINNILDYKQV